MEKGLMGQPGRNYKQVFIVLYNERPACHHTCLLELMHFHFPTKSSETKTEPELDIYHKSFRSKTRYSNNQNKMLLN